MSEEAITAETDRPWTVQECAEYLNLKVSTLYKWRWRGLGPPAFKAGRMLRYRPEDVQAWMATQRR